MRSWVRDNGLTIALMTLFAASFVGLAFTGLAHDNAELAAHHQPLQTLGRYLISGAFLSAVFENWESEFLQMGAYVTLTAYLIQRGSPESKDLDADAPQDRDPALDANNPDAPWPVRAGGLARTVYAHSLGLFLLVLFLASFVLHWLNSARDAAEMAVAHHQPPPTALEFLGQSQLWFESFQNWQSEFLSTAVLVVAAIYLRERGSPESKPVAAPHSKTGT